MPVYRQVDVFTTQSLIKLCVQQMTDQEFSLSMKMHVGEAPIGRARNDLTHEFLQSDATHLLFVDSDIIFSYDQVKKIVFDGVDIVGGFYVKKQEGDVALVCNTLNTIEPPDERGLMRAKFMGTGFLCITRKVFEVMIQEMGKDLAYVDDYDGKTVKYDFWRMGVDHDCVTGAKRWMSEDWQFCQFARKCGFEVWADANIMCNHSGHAIFPLSYQVRQLYTQDQLNRMKISVPPFKKVTEETGLAGESPRPPVPTEEVAA